MPLLNKQQKTNDAYRVQQNNGNSANGIPQVALISFLWRTSW